MASGNYRSCRTYTDEVRQSAVTMVQAGQPISAVAETLAIPRRTIVNWVNQAGPPLAAAPREQPSYADLDAELRTLRAEMAQLKEDNELLGKASAYFARHAQTRRS